VIHYFTASCIKTASFYLNYSLCQYRHLRAAMGLEAEDCFLRGTKFEFAVIKLIFLYRIRSEADSAGSEKLISIQKKTVKFTY